MNRRKFLVGTGCSVVATTVAGYTWTTFSQASNSLTIDSAISLLDSLDLRQVSTQGQWNLSRVFVHCAQSVECSMQGFPEHKSAIFKETVGSIAFSVFKAKGSMLHNTAEEIPGLYSNAAQISTINALKQLKEKLIAFKYYAGPLHDHFAYGTLNKREYEIAHVLHLLDHCSEFEIKT